MVTASRTQHRSFSISDWIPRWTLSWQQLLVGGLMALVLAFAMAVTYVRCLERELVTQQQSLIDERQALQVRWGQLLLERSTWSNPVHIQQVAIDAGMIVPNKIEMVKM